MTSNYSSWRALLWVLLVVSAAANAAASTGGKTLLSLGFGVVTVLCVAGLVLLHVRVRGRR